MSFLNPVNEPVLRFSSTDANAPQINYNSRVAGDVKAVLKACLVTGYGAKASAGWSAVNEVGNVINFVSPSVAMSDYQLGIDDSSASGTTWYYKYKESRINPTDNAPIKTFNYANETSAANGWDLIVTASGFYFIERITHSTIQAVQGRLTWFGRVKLALSGDNNVHNMGFWSVGYQAPETYSWQFFSSSSARYYKIDNYTAPDFAATNIGIMSSYPFTAGASVADMASELFLVKAGVMLGQHPGLLLTALNSPADRYGVYETTIDARPVLYVSLGVALDDLESILGGTRGVMIRLDNWGY